MSARLRAAAAHATTAGIVTATLAILLSVLPQRAFAAADGGTESVFATGAGNRALALGGAFTAVADDASAVSWNPAGLARVERRHLLASHASLYGLDIAEQHFAFAWPSWRWGTGALSVRRLGVDAIERRDDRNFHFGDFTESNLEIALGYARTVGEAWQFGGAAKLHRQEIAGFSDSGIGLDLGVLALPAVVLGREGAWTRRLTMGLTLRNALAPSIRLNQESVTDPVSVRFGTAYRLPFLGHGGILAAVDLEKPRDAGVDLHAGLEVTPHPLLALRAGWSGDSFTAGTGVSWDTYRFDYAYENGAIDDVHRFGLSMGFGATTTEMRASARAAEEEAFLARLENTFEARRKQQLDDLFANVQDALDQDHLEDAERLLETLRALAPQDERIASIEETILGRRAATAEVDENFTDAAILWGRLATLRPDDLRYASRRDHCRAESDRRAERSARIRSLFASALDAFTAGEFPTARVHLQDILQLAPDDAEARNMMARTESAISARVESLLGAASRALDRKILDEAAEHLASARALDPASSRLASLDARLRQAERDLQEQARADRAARAAAATSPGPVVVQAPVVKAPALSRKRQRELADLYRSGMEAMQDERPDDALRYWELVWAADPDYQSVADFLKREYLMRGLESFSSGGLDEAVRLWEKALQVDPKDEKTLGYLSRAREQASRSRELLGEEGR